MMIVDDAHVNYRVHASGKRVSAREGLSLSALRGQRSLKTVPALRGVTFTASEGETIGVVGHNGSGKSTLFRAMSGLIPTAEGRIWARDRPVLLGVNAALVPDLSGENNIKLGLLAMGFTAEEAAAHVDEIADFAELNEFIHHPMRTYSSGMGARLRFAIASAKAHSILLVDEALAVGDRRFRAKSDARIRELRDSAGLVMIVSHSASSLRDTCERALWVHKGELRADGPADDVIDEYTRWAKQPGGAVGAASPQAQRAKTAPVAVPAEVGLAASSADLSSSDVARRNRYRSRARAGTRRALITSGITLGAMIVAVGAGAAVALLTQAPLPDDSAAGAAATATSTPEAAAVPEIAAFAVAQPTITCETEESEVTVSLSWLVNDATSIAVAAGASEVDALDAPLVADLPALTSEAAVPFTCTAESLVYTLTAENADGVRTSATATVLRDPIVETEAPTDSSNSNSNSSSSSNSNSNSGTPSTEPTTDPVTPTDPEPTTDPEPEPTTDPEPEPTTDPEPTDPTDPGTTE